MKRVFLIISILIISISCAFAYDNQTGYDNQVGYNNFTVYNNQMGYYYYFLESNTRTQKIQKTLPNGEVVQGVVELEQETEKIK